jgi:hypothetical protein
MAFGKDYIGKSIGSRKPAVTIDGGRQLRRALAEIEGGIDDLKAIHLDMAQVVANRAKHLVPYQTGTLAQSIRGSGTKTASRVRAGYKRIGNYAGVTHFGRPRKLLRRGQEPTNFLYNALDEESKTVFTIYEDGINTIIKRGMRYAAKYPKQTVLQKRGIEV